MMTRWSECREVLSDSSSRDIPDIVNEDFSNNEPLVDYVENREFVNSNIVNSRKEIGDIVQDNKALDDENVEVIEVSIIREGVVFIICYLSPIKNSRSRTK